MRAQDLEKIWGGSCANIIQPYPIAGQFAHAMAVWRAMIAPVSVCVTAWSAWCADPTVISSSAAPEVADIPPMIRRRLSNLSRIALSVSHKCCGAHQPDYSVFCSRHGELARTTELLEALAAGEILSPTAFSQSVHNTAAGWFSILHKFTTASTSIAAGADGFGYGLLEAAAFLGDHPGTRVLVTAFDEPVPANYQFTEGDPAAAYGLALLLTDGPASLTVSASSLPEPGLPDTPPALSFLRYWQSGEQHGHAAGTRMNWQWERPDALH